MSPYLIITPAHNEEAFIETTIRSMINQKVRPVKWIIVNDSSTDSTREIVESYLGRYRFIHLLNISRADGRNFSNKAIAFNTGLHFARDFDYQYIGNLDADISLERDYYQRVLELFRQDRNLGMAGGMVSTCIGSRFVSQEVARDSVAGAIQFFRRACFEQIGGYLPLTRGGIDAAAEIQARMHGWKVQTFPELRVLEHRRTGSAVATPLSAKVNEGLRSQSLGYGFGFMFLRCLYRVTTPPVVIGSLATFYGYAKGVLNRNPIVLSPEVVRYLRHEQRKKLWRLIRPVHRLEKTG